MDDSEALRRAVIANPADDLPRLVFADWLEEHNVEDLARFIRTQVELANTLEWEPFAVRCYYHFTNHQPNGSSRWTLPPVDGVGLEWHPESTFQRGFPWSLVVRDMATLYLEAPRLFELAPLGQMELPNATLADWQRFVREPWFEKLTSYRFYGLTTPIEPIREMSRAAAPADIRELYFDVASGPAFAELLTDMMLSPMGKTVSKLEFRTGFDFIGEWVDQLSWRGWKSTQTNLRELSLSTIDMFPRSYERLFESQLGHELQKFQLRYCRTGGWALECLAAFEKYTKLTVLRLNRSHVSGFHLKAFARSNGFQSLRLLDLSEQVLELDDGLPRGFTEAPALSGLRSLRLRRCMLGDESVRLITESSFWNNLVELDLRDNQITNRGAEFLCSAPRPRDLTVLALSGNLLDSAAKERLRKEFADRIVLDDPEPSEGRVCMFSRA